MGNEVGLKTLSMEEALSIDAFKELVGELAKLPTAEEFKEKAENDLWSLVAGPESDLVTYEDLPERSKGLIGLIPNEDGGDTLPWWLESFRWSIREPGKMMNDEHINRELIDGRLVQFHTNSELLKPSLSSQGFPEILHKFNEILDIIEPVRVVPRHAFL